MHNPTNSSDGLRSRGLNRSYLPMLLATFSVFMAVPSTAAIISVDLFAPGDQLLTRDTTSGIEWLDLSATVGLSISEVVAGEDGWAQLGFVHAMDHQIRDLWLQIEPMAAEPFDATIKSDAASLSLAIQVNAFFGPTGMAGNQHYSLGLSGSTHVNGLHSAPFVTVLNVTDPNSAVFNNIFATTLRPIDFTRPDVGHWLVRPVPIPGAILFFLSALTGLIGIGRWQRT